MDILSAARGFYGHDLGFAEVFSMASKGVEVPASLAPLRDGNLGFKVKDPEGHDVEFVQLLPGSMYSERFGKALPDTRSSGHIIHVGFTVQVWAHPAWRPLTRGCSTAVLRLRRSPKSAATANGN